MNGTPEWGAPDRDGSPTEDRIKAALSSVSSHIEVTPRAFVAPSARDPGRHAGVVRSPLRWAAVIALIVGVTGLSVLFDRRIRDDVVVAGISGEDEDSPVAYEAPRDGTIDPLLLNYVAPINGDDGRLAERVFTDGVSWSRAKTITGCLEGTGRSEAESSWALAVIDWYTSHGPSAQASLPALRALAEDGLDRPNLDLVTPEVTSAVMACSDSDVSRASQWQRAVDPLREAFGRTVDGVIAQVETGPLWGGVRHCMTASGAPERADIGGYVDWLAGREARRPPGTNLSDTADGGGRATPESRSFSRCTTAFYAQVEHDLVAPRDAFVARHRDDLLRLQAEFAAIA